MAHVCGIISALCDWWTGVSGVLPATAAVTQASADKWLASNERAETLCHTASYWEGYWLWEQCGFSFSQLSDDIMGTRWLSCQKAASTVNVSLRCATLAQYLQNNYHDMLVMEVSQEVQQDSSTACFIMLLFYSGPILDLLGRYRCYGVKKKNLISIYWQIILYVKNILIYKMMRQM